MNVTRGPALLAMVLCIVLSGCDGRHSNPKIIAKKTSVPAWQGALSGDVHAMADGSAYIVGDARIFYISQGKMIEVHGIESSVSVTATLTPLADGTALLIDGYADPPRGFWLKQDSAEPISNSESAKLGTTTETAAGYYFVQATRLQQEVASQQLIPPEECSDYYDEAHDPDDPPDYE